MPLKRISDQNGGTIQDFYFDVIEKQKASSWNDSGKAMLNLIKRLDELFMDDTIWCLTSLYRLVLLTDDNWKSPWYVIISALESKEIYVEYRMPDDLKPWDDATVKGTANSLDRAVEYVLIAMHRSAGWHGMDSLERLIK
jgi:hypothetical protein